LTPSPVDLTLGRRYIWPWLGPILDHSEETQRDSE